MQTWTRARANALLIVVALVWGSAFVAQSWGMSSIGPMLFTGLRFLLGALVVLPLAWLEMRALHAKGQAFGRRGALQIAGLGLLLFIGAMMQQIGITSTSVTNAGFLTALYVPLVPVLALVFMKQRPHWIIWPAALGSMAGTWLLAGAHSVDINVGDWWVILSAFPWSIHVLLVGRTADKINAPYTLACGQFVLCGVLACIAGFGWEPYTWDGIQAAWGAIAYTGILSVGFGFTGQVIGQRYARASDAAIVLSSETVFAAVFGALFMGDRLSAYGFAGCGIILLCILLVQLVPMWRPGKAMI
ncbi:MAG: DMT family transporter [Burkholderiaceae bacterium]|nr:MAG: DMT family transporter [Burkholderiaceae bacterium]